VDRLRTTYRYLTHTLRLVRLEQARDGTILLFPTSGNCDFIIAGKIMRRISTDYSNRLPDDFVALVLTKEEVRFLLEVLDYCDPDDFDNEEFDKFQTVLKKLTEGDKWSES